MANKTQRLNETYQIRPGVNGQALVTEDGVRWGQGGGGGSMSVGEGLHIYEGEVTLGGDVSRETLINAAAPPVGGLSISASFGIISDELEPGLEYPMYGFSAVSSAAYSGESWSYDMEGSIYSAMGTTTIANETSSMVGDSNFKFVVGQDADTGTSGIFATAQTDPSSGVVSSNLFISGNEQGGGRITATTFGGSPGSGISLSQYNDPSDGLQVRQIMMHSQVGTLTGFTTLDTNPNLGGNQTLSLRAGEDIHLAAGASGNGGHIRVGNAYSPPESQVKYMADATDPQDATTLKQLDERLSGAQRSAIDALDAGTATVADIINALKA